MCIKRFFVCVSKGVGFSGTDGDVFLVPSVIEHMFCSVYSIVVYSIEKD